jgi:hypothetical protein
MNIDLEDIESLINEGIYGDDRMTDRQRDDVFAALAVLLAEVRRLQQMQPKRDYYASLGAAQERAAVVAALRRCEPGPMGLSLVDMASVANDIERGEHRTEDKA